jgi:hypothetical protein
MTAQRLTTPPSSIPTDGYPTTSGAPTASPAATAEAPAAGTAPGEAPGAIQDQWPPPTSWPPQPSPPHRPLRGRRTTWLIAAVAAALVLALVIATGAFLVGRATQPSGQPQPGGAGPGVSGHAPATSGVSAAQISSVAATVDPGIVDINTVLGYQNTAAAGTGIVLVLQPVVVTGDGLGR